ncbi:TRAP transporter substrate-binding protein [Cellulosilyticum sp. I15G10I2]|uniref:TRAP transporter substrate-binding protein n=1 Tax=Cellulosilyticum sp. I15G10I2 TaxID=1892843 RepID=UPI00085C0A39|nr:TRAP transporter substrate-binding protein [Cellulosilyticum sp. I15G10I2]
MKKLLCMIGALALTFSMAGCAAKPEAAKSESKTETTAPAASEAPAEVIKLRVAHNQTSLDNPYQYGLTKFAEELEKLSGGTMVAEVYPGTLGTNESELAMKLTTDSVDMVVASPGFMASTGVKEFDLLSLLYLFDSFEHWESTIDGEFGDTMKSLISEKTDNEFKVVGYYSSGVRNYYGKKPITVPADAAGLNIRLQASPVQQQFWQAAGANPVSVGWQELYQALSTGTTDAAENDHTNMMLQEHHKTPNGKYTSLTAHDYTTRLLLMNGRKFDGFTEEQQGWILEASKASVAEERAVTYKMLEESKEKIVADGGVINEVDLETFRTLAMPIQDAYAKENGLEDLLALTRK